MAITVSEILKLYPISRSKLIAGKTGLGKVVKSANIQEVPNVEQWLQGGEVLFTAGYAFKEISDLGYFIKAISDSGASAIFFKPGQYLSSIPEEMIRSAEKIGLPLFELPTDIAYMDCILPIFELITKRQVTTLRRTENFYNDLTQSMLRQEGLVGICNILCQATTQDVIIIAPSGTGILAKCDANPESDSPNVFTTDIFIDFLEKNINTNTFRGLKPNSGNSLSINNKWDFVCVPIHSHNKCVAYLLLDSNYHEISEVDMIAIEHASSLIALEIIQEQSLIEKEQKIQEKLLEDILMKRYTDEAMLYRRGISMGIDLTKPFVIFTIDPYEFEAFVNNEMREVSESEVQNLKNKIHNYVYEELHNWRKPKLLLTRSVRIIVFVSVTKNKSDMDSLNKVLASILTRLNTLHPKLNFNIGISRIKNSFKSASEAEKESLLAVTCVNTQQNQSNGIINFDDLGALRFLIELSDSESMRDFYQEHIKVLLEYDEKHDSDLLKTLECYFDCNKNYRETADRLYIHKNSAVYRIKKIEALTGVSLADGNDSFNLQICLLLKKLL